LLAVRRYIIKNPISALKHQEKKYTQRLKQKSNFTNNQGHICPILGLY
jgi:hypothetical protein